ncbi:MAG: biotin transporter BioY [Solirubrobacteraceae bacterium]
MTTASAYAQRRPLVLSDLIPGALLRDVLLVLAGAGLTGALAQFSIPVPGSPVPITGQTLGALLAGATLGWRRGGAALALYLLAGMAGMPWFADHAHGTGMPDLGYIIGFVFAAAAAGAIAAHGGDRTPVRMIATMIIGNLIIYAIGVPYLMLDLHIGLPTAWSIGVKNYLPGDAIKILIAAALLPTCWRLVANRSPKTDTRR